MTHLSSLDNFKHIYREFQYQKPNGTYKNCFQDPITHAWQDKLALKWGMVKESKPIIDDIMAIFGKPPQNYSQKLFMKTC